MNQIKRKYSKKFSWESYYSTKVNIVYFVEAVMVLFFVGLSASAAPTSSPQCLVALNSIANADNLKTAGSVIFRPDSISKIKNYRNFRIADTEVKPSLHIQIEQGDSPLPFSIGKKVSLNPQTLGPGSTTKPFNEIFLERPTSKLFRLSSKLIYGNYQELQLVRQGNKLVADLPELKSWAELSTAMRLATKLARTKPRPSKYSITLPIPESATEHLPLLLDIANQLLLPLLIPYTDMDYFNISKIHHLIPALDASIRFENDGSQSGPSLKLEGNLEFAESHLTALQFLLTVMELKKEQSLISFWSEASKTIDNFEPFPLHSKYLEWVSPSSSIPVPNDVQISSMDFPSKYRYLEPVNPQLVSERLTKFFGPHWPLIFKADSIYMDQNNVLPFFWKFFPSIKKLRKQLSEQLFSNDDDKNAFTTVFEIEEEPSLAKLFGESPRDFLNRFGDNGIFLSVLFLRNVKHAEIYDNLIDTGYLLQHGTFAFIELGKEEKTKFASKLKILNQYRFDLGFPIFTYSANEPLYILPRDKSGEFTISVESPGLSTLEPRGLASKTLIRTIEKNFLLSQQDGSYYLQSKDHPYIKFPLVMSNQRFMMSSMSCAQWTYFVARTLFPDKSFRSFSSPDELATLIKRGEFPDVKFVESW